jgi:hypothetical protein
MIDGSIVEGRHFVALGQFLRAAMPKPALSLV